MAIKTITQLDKFDNESQPPATIPLGSNLYYYIATDDNKNAKAANKDDSLGQNEPPALNVNDEKTYFGSYFEISRPKDKTKKDDIDTPSTAKYYSEKLSYEQLMKNIVLDAKTILDHTNYLSNINVHALGFENYKFDGNKIFLKNVSISGNLDVKGDARLCSTLGVSGDTTLYSDLTVLGHTYIDQYLKVNGDISCLSNIFGNRNLYITEDIYAKNGYFENNLSSKYLTALTATIENAIISFISASNLVASNLVANDGAISNLTVNTINVLTSVSTPEIYVNKIHKYPSGGNGVISCDCNVDFENNSLTAGECYLTASSARWSDLAEYYHSDEKYEPGTLVKFGGEKELTIADDDDANAVVTSKPGYLMNSEFKNTDGIAIALVGRVPVKVIGPINKFDDIILSIYENGIACTKDYCVNRKDKIMHDFLDKTIINKYKVIGKSLETNLDEKVKLVECVVQLKI